MGTYYEERFGKVFARITDNPQGRLMLLLPTKEKLLQGETPLIDDLTLFAEDGDDYVLIPLDGDQVRALHYRLTEWLNGHHKVDYVASVLQQEEKDGS